MRLPRVQLSVRRAMAAVAALAIALGIGIWAERMWRRSRDFRAHAAVHRAAEQLANSYGHNEYADYHARMRQEYEDAAWHPWRTVAPDPPRRSESPPAPGPGGVVASRSAAEGGGAAIRVTVEVIPKPDGEPYHDGEPIRCKGRLSWEGVGPPEDVLIVLQPGLFPDVKFAKCDEKLLPVKPVGEGRSPGSGTADWEGSIRANRVQGIDDYIIVVTPLGEYGASYRHEDRPVRGSRRLKITR